MEQNYSSNDPGKQCHPPIPPKEENKILLAAGAICYLVLAAAAFLLPIFLTAKLGIYWGALIYFAVAAFWVIVMPCTCMSGGLISSMIAMPIALGGIIAPLCALVKFVRSLF